MGMPRMSARRWLRSMVIAAADREQWGEPVPTGVEVAARVEGTCVRCGFLISVRDPIITAKYGDNMEGWMHYPCPSPWIILAALTETYDSVHIMKAIPEGRGRAAGCRHDVDGKPCYLVRNPVPLDAPNACAYMCESCVTQGKVSE